MARPQSPHKEVVRRAIIGLFRVVTDPNGGTMPESYYALSRANMVLLALVFVGFRR